MSDCNGDYNKEDDHVACGVELELDSEEDNDSIEQRRGTEELDSHREESNRQTCLFEPGREDSDEACFDDDSDDQLEKISYDDPRASKVHEYIVYDDECYKQETEEWRNSTKFVAMTDPLDELAMERQNLLDQRESVASGFIDTLNMLRTGKLCDIMEAFNNKKREEIAKLGKEPTSEEKRSFRRHRGLLDHDLNEMTLSDELNEVARSVWLERTAIPDGFMVLPDHTISRNGKTYGCMVFCTPKTDEEFHDYLGRFTVYYWLLDAIPSETLLCQVLTGHIIMTLGLKPQLYYPHYVWPCKAVHPENYPYDTKRCQGLFADQLLEPDCGKVGIYFDMVQMTDCAAWSRLHPVKNLACLVAVFETPVDASRPGYARGFDYVALKEHEKKAVKYD